MSEALELIGVRKTFGGVAALEEVSLTLPPGGFLALLGPSGCGKSTLLRCIAGFEAPDAGEIVIAGKTVFSAKKGINLPPGERNLGMMFQSYALWPHMTIFDNIGFGLELAGVAKPERRERVLAALRDVGLEGLDQRYPSQLSGGQQQRVALARLLACRPPVFLMDEPLSNLDARLRMDMRTEIRRLHDQCKALTVYVTHDQGEAMALADLVVVMNKGRVEQADAPDAVYLQPASLFVADFVGLPRMNILPATCRREAGGEAVLHVAGLRIPAQPGLAEGAYRVAFRPEDVQVSPEPGEAGASLHVDAVMPAGPEVLVHLSGAGEHIVARIGRRALPHAGADTSVRVDPAAVNVFDAGTGRLVPRLDTPGRARIAEAA